MATLNLTNNAVLANIAYWTA